jgi:hypothetical protein
MARVREILLPWDSQPQEAVRVNPEIPIRPEFAWVGSNSSHDLVLGKSAIRPAGVGNDAAKSFGIATPFVGSTTNALTFAGGATAAKTAITFISVFEWTSGSGNSFPQLMGASSSNSGFRLGSDGGGINLGLVKGGLLTLNSVALTTATPYVLVCSHRQDTGEYYLLVRPLSGGATLRTTQTETTVSSAGDGVYGVGTARTDYSGAWNGFVGMSFMSFDFLPESIGLDYIGNPWKLFAPQTRYIPVSAGGGTPTLLPSGISSLEAFGTASISVGPISVLVSGISSSEAFGTHVLSNGSIIIVPSGIASLEAFGTAILDRGTVIVSPSGISTAEAFGTASALVGTLVIYPNGISSAELFGIPAITGGTPSLITSVFYVRGFSSFGNRRNY